MAISALFLGLELMGDLDPRRADTDGMFAGIAALAQLADAMLAGLADASRLPPPAQPADDMARTEHPQRTHHRDPATAPAPSG